jgi:hypothetical protein
MKLKHKLLLKFKNKKYDDLVTKMYYQKYHILVIEMYYKVTAIYYKNV